MNTDLLLQLLVNGVIIGTLYGVVAMTFVLIYKSTQVVNFAQGEFLLIGAWVCWAFLVHFEMPFWLGFPLTLVFMFAFGVLLQVVCAAAGLLQSFAGDASTVFVHDLLVHEPRAP